MNTVLATREFQMVPIKAVRESATNPRRHRNEAALKELTQSVREHGVLVPLLLRSAHNGAYEIVAGSRRYQAAKLAGLEELPARIREMTDTQVLEIQILENLQREDVHPLDEALGYRALMKQAHYDVAAIAAKVGKSASYVYQRLKLAELIKPAQDAFLKDELTAGHAILLARLQPKDQQRALDVCSQPRWDRAAIRKGALDDRKNGRYAISVRQLAGWIDEEIHLDLHSAPWKKDDADLVAAAGPCTTCPKRTGNNPQLFPDVKKGDTCTDPTCFAAKMAAFMTRKREELRAEGTKAVQLSEEYYSRPYGKDGPRDLVYHHDWKEAKPGSCKHLVSGLVTDGRRKGHVISVCVEKQCTTHYKSWERRQGAGPSPQEKAAQRRKQAHERLETTKRRRIFDAVIGKVRAPLDQEDLRLIARAAFNRLWSDNQKRLATLLEWKVTRSRYGNDGYEAAANRAIAAMDAQGLAQFLMRVALITEMVPSPWSNQKPEKLMQAAARHKVDVRAIERSLKAEAAAAGKKPRHRPGKAKRLQTSPKGRR